MALVLTLNDYNAEPVHITTSSGDHITVDVLKARNGQARIAFTAADDVIIDRDVIHQKKLKERNR